MSASYIFQLTGDYYAGAKRTWFAERLDEETDLETTLTDIEQQEKVGRKLVRVIEVESLRDVTEEIRALLDVRAGAREAEAAKAYADSPLEAAE